MADTIDALRTEVEKAEEGLKMKRDEVDRLGRHLTSHHREAKALERDLSNLDRERGTTLVDHPKELEAIRTKRREMVQRRDDLTDEMVLLESKVGEAQQEQVEALATLHIAIRRKVQGEGAAVAAGMRKSICTLEKAFDMYLTLAREDQRAKDVLVGISSHSSDNSVPTFSYATAVNGRCAESIRSVVQEKDKAESELRTRQRAAVGVV